MAEAAFTPFPTVGPTGAPRDYSNVRATPEEFGSSLGQAQSKMGSAISATGEAIFDAAHARALLQDELQANDIHSQKIQQMQDTLSDFTKLQGDAANKALPEFNKSITSIAQDALDNAPNLKTKELISASLRYSQDRMLNYGRQHADTEFLQWQNQSATDGAMTHANSAALAALNDNPRDLDISLEAGKGNITKFAEQNYRDPKPLVQKYVGETISNIIKASISEGNLDKAQSIFDKYKNQMDAGGLLAAESALKPALQAVKVDRTVNDAVYGKAPIGENYRGYSDRSTVSDSIKFFEGKGWTHAQASGIVANLFQESGLRSTGPHGDSGYAMGLGQWHPDRQALLQKFASEHKLNPNDVRTQLEFVQWELDNSEKGAGERVKAAGSASDAAAAADQFYERSSGEARSQRMSNAERFAAGNFSGSSPASNVLPPKGETYARVMQATEDDPTIRTKALAKVNEIYSNWNTENAVQQKNLVDNVPKMISDAESGLIDPETIPYPRTEIRNYMPAEQANRWDSEFDTAVAVGQLVKGLRWAPESDIQQIKEDLANGRGVVGELLAQKAGDDPTAHYRLQSTGDARLTQMLKDRQTQLSTDPAKFVQSNPAVDAAFKAMSVADPKSFEKYAQASLVVQQQLGVSSQFAHVLTKEQAQGAVKSITSQGGDPKQALNLLQSRTGAAWPQVYSDLVSLGKMPAEYQAMQILTDPGDLTVMSKALQEMAKDPKMGWTEKLGGAQIKIGLDTAVTSGLSDYVNSLRQSGASEQDIDNMTHAVRILAYGQKYFNNKDTAAPDAVKSFVGQFSYIPQGGARIPTQIYDTVNGNAQKMLQQITGADITMPEGVGGAGQPSKEAYLSWLKSAPEWVTAPTGDRLFLREPGGFGRGRLVRGADGEPLSVMFSGPKPYGSFTPKQPTAAKGLDFSKIVDAYRDSLSSSKKFSTEQVDQMTQDYAKGLAKQPFGDSGAFGLGVRPITPLPPTRSKDDLVSRKPPELPVAILGVRG